MEGISRALVLALFTATASCRSTETRHAIQVVQSERVGPGTYNLHLCRVTCDPSLPRNEIRRGWVVLDSIPIHLDQFSDSVRQALAMGATFRGPEAGNGCFRLLTTRPDVESYAGIAPGGLIHWAPIRGGDSVSFALYQSPDAGHEVRIRGTALGFVGSGESWGAGAAAVDYPADVVLAEYVGPPDVARCAEAAGAVAAWASGPE
jgi:hypothetical protein